MKTVLERAREEAFVGRERAAAYLAQVKACAAEGYNDDEDVSFAAGALEEAQATLDALDAAIAAGTPAKGGITDINIDLGDGQSVTLNVSATDLRKLTEVLSRSRRVRPFADWTEQELRPAIRALEDAIAPQAQAPAPAKDTKPLRIPFADWAEPGIRSAIRELEELLAKAAANRVNIELDLERPSITVDGNPLDAARVMKCLLAQDPDLSTGANVGPGLVGERAGEAIASVTPTADIMASYGPERTPHPCTIRLGDEFEVLTISDRDSLVRSLGKVVEIFADGGPKDSLYRVEIERAAGWRLDYEADDRDIKERHQRISTLVPLDNLRRL